MHIEFANRHVQTPTECRHLQVVHHQVAPTLSPIPATPRSHIHLAPLAQYSPSVSVWSDSVQPSLCWNLEPRKTALVMVVVGDQVTTWEASPRLMRVGDVDANINGSRRVR